MKRRAVILGVSALAAGGCVATARNGQVFYIEVGGTRLLAVGSTAEPANPPIESRSELDLAQLGRFLEQMGKHEGEANGTGTDVSASPAGTGDGPVGTPG